MDIDTAREMLAAATAGPLSAEFSHALPRREPIFQIRSPDGHVAQVWGEANARLFIQAPATLAALILAVEALENALAEIHYHHGCDPDCEEKRHKALAAWEKL